MTRVRATCRDCGDVELCAGDLTMRHCVDSGARTYSFRCPLCAMVEVRDAPEPIRAALDGVGVGCVDWHLPAELGEHPEGSPFCPDDADALRALLEDVDWIRRLVSDDG